MDAGSGHVVYVYFQNPTYPRDFPGTDISIGPGGDYTGPLKPYLIFLMLFKAFDKFWCL